MCALLKLVVTCPLIQFICRAFDACFKLGICQCPDWLAHCARFCCCMDLMRPDIVYIEINGTLFLQFTFVGFHFSVYQNLPPQVTSISPMEVSTGGILNFIVTDIFFAMIKFIPVKDKRTGQTKHYGIGTFLHMPATHRFDLKARARVKRGIQTVYVKFCTFTHLFSLTTI